jgi:hypothetical protein
VTSTDRSRKENIRRGDHGEVRGDIRGEIGAHGDLVRSSHTDVEHASGSRSAASTETVVVADGPPSLNETAALVLAVIVRDWIETAGKAGGGEQDSAA